MPKINVLDKHTAELIAAGEVVERPASAIKELCENAIDAGAKTLTVEIKFGGIKYIRVTDDGCGIEREDVPKAFLRHATSKVKTAKDLEAIGTLGFRGEALASISAVSKVELITRTEDEFAGTSYIIHGGDEISYEDTGCPKGTTIIVRDLFYNVPARMKFLKKDTAEGIAVSGVVEKIALSHPEIAVTLIRDGRKVMSTSGDGKLLSAIHGVLGREFAKEIISVNYSMYGIEISGYISKPENARPTRNMQNFFLNGRYVKSRTAMAALEEACKGSVTVGKFPSCVMQISMSCNVYDVNVHPSKLEVRFTNERPLFDCIYHAVKTALLNTNEKQIELNTVVNKPKSFEFIQKTSMSEKYGSELEEIKKNITKPKTEDKEPQIFTPKKAITYPINTFDDNEDIMHDKAITPYSLNAVYKEEEEVLYVPEKTEPKEEKTVTVPTNIEQTKIEEIKTELKFVGEAFDTYIILEKNSDELLLIDKHAAHERLIYEKLKREVTTFSQMLLSPISVVLSTEEYMAVLDNKEIFSKAGYEIEDFGRGTVIVQSAPQYLSDKEISDSVVELAGYLVHNKNVSLSDKAENIFHRTACRAALKAGNKSSSEELIALVKELEENPKLKHCPHGRPISTIIKKRELEKQFCRT